VDVSVTITRVAMSVSVSPTSLSWSGTALRSTSPSVTATATGGTGPYSYAWTYVSGDTPTINSPSSATTTIRSPTTSPDGGETSGWIRVTATDSSSPTPVTATADLLWDYTNNYSTEP
jgi:hypothetical protein